MASTIAGTATNWTITSPAGQLSGAAINHANATLEDDGTVVIKSADGVLWAGNIMTLGGLTGATPALRYADLLNNYLTGFSAGGATGPLSTITFLGSQLILSSPFSGDYLFPFTSTSLSNGTPFATLSGNRALFSRGGYFLFNNKLGSGANGSGGTDRITLRLRRTRAMVDSIIMEQSATCRVSNPAAAIIVNVQPGDEYWWDFNVNTGAATITIQGFASFTYMNVIELNASTGTTVDNAVDTGEAIVTGAAPVYIVKRFKAGTDIALSSTGTAVTIDATRAIGFKNYQSAAPDPAPVGISTWIPSQTLTVTGTPTANSRILVTFNGYWLQTNPPGTLTGQFAIRITKPDATTEQGNLLLSTLNQSLPSTTDWFATVSMSMTSTAITAVGNYTIDVIGSVLPAGTASGLWDLYASVIN